LGEGQGDQFEPSQGILGRFMYPLIKPKWTKTEWIGVDFRFEIGDIIVQKILTFAAATGFVDITPQVTSKKIVTFPAVTDIPPNP